jgi:hypothetical protein
VRVDAGPDAAEGVMDDCLVGTQLRVDGLRGREVFSGGAGLLCDGARMVMGVILRTVLLTYSGPDLTFGVSVVTFVTSN